MFNVIAPCQYHDIFNGFDGKLSKIERALCSMFTYLLTFLIYMQHNSMLRHLDHELLEGDWGMLGN